MKLLLTAFEPFGGEAVNPAEEAMGRMPDRVGDVEIVKLAVPVTFAGCLAPVAEAIEREAPDAVLCLGQAGGRAAITPERVAVNVDDARIPDNAGEQPVDRPAVPGGPAAYFATLPVKAMAEAIRAAGVAAEVSNTAGTFVCNHLMYAVLHLLAERYPGVWAGFMHVPFVPEQTGDKPGQPSMPLADMVRGLTAAVGAIFGA